MKKLFILFFLPLLWACSSDSKDDDLIEKNSIVGVWEFENYFISFNDEGFYSAYIADEFIDSGSYVKSGNTVLCENMYFNRKTTYEIRELSAKNLEVDIKYIDLNGGSHDNTMTLVKSLANPSQYNSLSGKSYSWYSSIFGNITMAFNTYNSGVKSATKGNAAKYPLKFFYIVSDNKLFYQTLNETSIQVPSIGSWSVDYNTVKCWELFFNPNGSIKDIKNISL